jgi:uncharacterized protein (TIGR03083 family)
VPSVNPRRSLELLKPAVEALNADIRALSADQWQAESSCKGWQVGDLVAHVVRNGWSMLEYVKRNLAGNPEPPFGPHVQPIQDAIKGSGPAGAAQRQADELDEFIALYDTLRDEQLNQPSSGHPSGSHPLSWPATQRLLEVAYHHWDLKASLADPGPMDHQLASYLLAFMLDPSGRPAMGLPAPAKDTEPETFRLQCVTDGQAWRVTAGAHGLTAEPGEGPASATVEAEAGWLALAVYGRANIRRPSFIWSGSPDAVARFAIVFGD